MQKQKKKRKKSMAFLRGFLAFVLTVGIVYAPKSALNEGNVSEALASGDSRTFNNTNIGRNGANVNNSTGVLGANPTFPGQTGIYHWTVPETGTYEIETWGASGSPGFGQKASNYGLGARMKGEFNLTKGTILKILVGQQGYYPSGGSLNSCSTSDYGSGGGGGGTFVATSNDTPLIVAAGGSGSSEARMGCYEKSGTAPYSGYGPTIAVDGSATIVGNGDGGAVVGYSGSSFYTNGSAGSASFVQGGVGGNYLRTYYTEGGFGGGGVGDDGGGSGGGYVGGKALEPATSYNDGFNQSNSSGQRTGHGLVVITQLLPQISTQSPANATKFQNSYIDVSWNHEAMITGASVSKYEIKAGTASGGTDLVAVTNIGAAKTHRITVPAGTPGNTTIYWSVRAYDHGGNVGPWKQQTVIYSNNVPTIIATTNTPAKLDVSLEKRNHGFKINSLKDLDDFNYVTLFADVLDGSGNVIAGSKKQIVLDSSLVNSAQLINDATEKKGSLQGPVNHTTPFDLKLSLQPDFTTGKFDLTLTKADGVTNVIKSGEKLLTGRAMQASSATNPESYTLRIYPEDRQNTNTLAASPLAGVNDVAAITIPFTSDTRNYLPSVTNVKHDVANRVFSEAEGFNRISVTGHVDDSDPTDVVTMYYEVQPKADNYSIQVTNSGGKVVPRYGKAVATFQPKVDNDFAFTYQIASELDTGDYALLVYGYDSQEGIGDYVEIPFTVRRDGPTIDFIADYQTQDGQTITMSSAQKQIVAEDNKVKLYFTPNNYATFEYAGYLVRGGTVKDLRIRGAFTNEVNATFIGVDFGKDPITLLGGEQTDFQLGDVVVFQFKATSATGIVTQKDVRILIGNDQSTFAPLSDVNLPQIK